MPIVIMILKFIGIQILQAILTAQMVKDVVLAVLKFIASKTKTTFDDKIYKKVRFYMLKDKSERFKAD